MLDNFNKNNQAKEVEIKHCKELILSKNPRDRSYAAKRLGELKINPDLLIGLLNDLNGFVRSAAAEALGRSVTLPAPEVVSHLLAAIDDHNNYVCAAAVNSLGLLQAEQAAEQINACLQDSHPIIVQAAILAMARIDPNRIKDQLMEFLHSEEYLIHLAATRACGWLIYQDSGAFTLQSLKNFMADNDQQDLKLPKLYIEVLARLQMKEAIPTLVEIAEKEIGLRGIAVEALIEMNAEEAAAILSPLLNDPSNRLRRNLVEMMMHADYNAALPLVRPLLRDNAITVRETALAAVAKWQDRVSVEDVRNIAFNDPNPFVRPQAVITLVKLLGQEALPDLIELSDDLNLHVRRAVAQNLVHMEYLTPEAKAALLRLAKDENTAEFVLEALDKHALPNIQPLPAAGPTIKAPLPDTLHGQTGALLNLLETWQDSLPELIRNFKLDELSEVDHALSTLIIYLREADHRPRKSPTTLENVLSDSSPMEPKIT